VSHQQRPQGRCRKGCNGAVAQPDVLQKVVHSINERRSGQIKPLRDELVAVQARIDKLEEKKRKYLGLYEMDEIDHDLFAGWLNDLNRELDAELPRLSRLRMPVRSPAPPLAVSAAQDPAAPDREEDHARQQEARRQRRAGFQRGDREAFFKRSPFR